MGEIEFIFVTDVVAGDLVVTDYDAVLSVYIYIYSGGMSWGV